MEPTICIYAIKNNVNGKMYIGQTSDYAARVRSHKTKLNNGNHFNAHLQNAWNKYGPDIFIFKVLDWCDISQLNEKEQFYIKEYKSFHDDDGYNLNTGGAKYRKHSQYVKSKMSEKARGRKKTDIHKARIGEANRGRKPSQETLEKVRRTKEERLSQWGERNGNAIISDEIARAIILDIASGLSYPDIYKKYEVSDGMFYNLKGNHTYKHILPEIRDTLRREYKYKLLGEKIITLYKGGMSQSAISKKIGVTRNFVAKTLRNHGMNTQLHKNQFLKEEVVLENAV